MSTDNKEQFNLMAGRILSQLVNACPLPVVITAEVYDLPKGEKVTTGSGIYTTHGYRQTPEETLLANTLKWLCDEGFVRVVSTDRYVATMQALRVYGSIPNALSE